ncbi:hypothetical protein ACOMHN_038287 [Nucella lapillus]
MLRCFFGPRLSLSKLCWLMTSMIVAVVLIFLKFNSFPTLIKPTEVHKKYFLISPQRLTWNNSTVSAIKVVEVEKPEQKCVHPDLDPNDPAIMQFQKTQPDLDCHLASKEWVHVVNSTLYLSAEARRQYGEITCEFRPVLRNGDFYIGYGPGVKLEVIGTRLQSDFFRVHCKSASGKEYTNVHAAVAPNKAVMRGARDYHHSVKSPDASNERSKQDSLSLHNLNLSVFMLGFDSLSRMAWRRNMPKAHEYFTDTLGALELEGYNIVGDGTTAALLPILTGKMEEELPEARRGFEGAKPVDGHPWIWREFSKRGFITAYAEDRPDIGTFHYRMLGFQDPPTDHFMRPFYLAAAKAHLPNRPFCWGSKPEHTYFMNWFGSLLDTYRDFPKFFFGFNSAISHDDNTRTQAMDDDLVAFLKELEAKGHLNSTLVILMADHGARYDYIRSTAQGKLEERLPYFSLRFPPWFSKLYPTIIRNVQVNTKRLTTPFDIHATFLHMLKYSSSTNVDLSNRAVSLFTEIPRERTCTDAEVTPHWCACLTWHSLNQSDPLVERAVATAIQTINGYTKEHRSICAELKLHAITKSLRYVPSSVDRTAEWKLLKYVRSPRQDPTELYQLSFQTVPGHGHFEVTCTYDVTSRQFSVKSNEISRINKYGSQPACIQHSRPDLRPYCYCV